MFQPRLPVWLIIAGLLISLVVPKARAQAPNEIAVPEGTKIRLALQTPISSKLNEVGDQLLAILYEPLLIDGKVVLPRGTEVQGRITGIKPAKRPQKQASMTIVFDRVITPYGIESISLSLASIEDYVNDNKLKADGEGKVKGGRRGADTVENVARGAQIGGAGAGMILLGGGGAGPAIGTLGAGVIGGLLLTKGKDIRLQPGTIFRVMFSRPVSFPAPPTRLSGMDDLVREQKPANPEQMP